MTALRAGIIGLGVGEQHIEGYRRSGCEVAALCDLDEERLREVGRRNPGAVLTTSAEEVLGDPAIDVVSIASYEDHHHRQVMAALRACKHVFVEKPICLHRWEADEVWAELRNRPDQRLSCNLPLRESPRFRTARDLVRADELGRLYYVEADYDYGRPWKLTEGWRGELDFYSVVHGGLVHMVDLLLWITGDRPLQAVARGSHLATEGTRFRFNDLVVATLELESGALAKLTANFACRHPHFHELKLFGTEGTFVNAPGDAVLYRGYDDDPRPEPISAPYPGVAKHAAIPGFVAAIRAREAPPIPPPEIFAGMAVCFAIEDAADSGDPVEVRGFD